MEKRIELERRGKEPNQVTELNLDNCRSTQIEGLTEEYTVLDSLSMINVGLTNLKGFPKLPELQKLELSDNRISGGLNMLQGCPRISHLNVSGNKIKDLEALDALKTLENLTHLDLFNNPLGNEEEDYRNKVFKLLPNLKYLDGTDINNEEDEESDVEDGQNGVDDDDDLDGDDDDEDEDGEEEEDEEDEDGPGLSAIYNDNLGDDEDGDDFEEGEEEEDEDIEEEEEEQASEEPRGKRRKTEDGESAGDAPGGEDETPAS